MHSTTQRPAPMLVSIPFGTATGFAITALERAFYRMAVDVAGDENAVHFAYESTGDGSPAALPDGFENYVALDFNDDSSDSCKALYDYVSAHGVRTVFGLDLPPVGRQYSALRQGGVETVFGYYGSPMSDPQPSWRRALNHLAIATLGRRGPDHLIFESYAMRNLAKHRGIDLARTSVVRTGTDPSRFDGNGGEPGYAHVQFDIPSDRRIVLYSGHATERKGVRTLMRTWLDLVELRGRRDIHLLIVGDRDGEKERFVSMLDGHSAVDFVTFGGYRNDLPRIAPDCVCAAIVSDGWDSFPMSSIEAQASGLPVVASDFQGVKETIEPGISGLLAQPGDPADTADQIEKLVDDEALRSRMSDAARRRVEVGLNTEVFVHRLTDVVRWVGQDQ